MKKIIVIISLILMGFIANSQVLGKLVVGKFYAKDTAVFYKGLKFSDGTLMTTVGGSSSDTVFWNYPQFPGHKMINAKNSKIINVDSGFASSGFIWLRAAKTYSKGSYFIGYGSPNIENTGTGNNTFGYNAGGVLYSGSYNNIFGYNAGAYLYDGYQNVFNGYNAGYSSTSANNNVFIGAWAGYSNVSGAYNSCFGKYAGYNSTGSNNLFLGYSAGKYYTTENHIVKIGTYDCSTKAGDSTRGIHMNEGIDTNSTYVALNGNTNIRGTLKIHGKEVIYDNYKHEYEYMQVVCADAEVDASNTTIKFSGLNSTQIEYFTQAGTAPYLKIKNKDWLYPAMDDVIEINGNQVIITVVNTDVTGTGTPADGDTLVIGYNQLTVTHNLNSLYTQNIYFTETTFGAGYIDGFQSTIATRTVNAITYSTISGCVWKINAIIIKLD